MSRYAKIVGGVVVQYPYTFMQLRRDNPQVSYPRDPTDEMLAQWDVTRIAEVPRPAPSGLDRNVVEGQPEAVNGVWTQRWAEVPASAEEVDVRQIVAIDAAETAEVKADGVVAQFLAMSPGQLTAYISNNSGTLAALRTVVTKLAVILLILAKRSLR